MTHEERARKWLEETQEHGIPGDGNLRTLAAAFAAVELQFDLAYRHENERLAGASQGLQDAAKARGWNEALDEVQRILTEPLILSEALPRERLLALCTEKRR